MSDTTTIDARGDAPPGTPSPDDGILKRRKVLMEPRLMPVGYLTAAIQEPNMNRQLFWDDPERAALQAATFHLGMAGRIGVDEIELAAALAFPDAYIPAEQMLDPVAAHLAARTKPDGTGTDLSQANAGELIAHARNAQVRIGDIGFFENMLHPDVKIRTQIHEHFLRCVRSVILLRPAGCRGVTIFIGRDKSKSIDQNLVLFEELIVPLLKKVKETAPWITIWVENCPMPGWGPEDTFIHNIAYSPAMWVLLSRIAKKHGVDDILRFTYDASHDILMGSTPGATFAFLKAAKHAHIIDRVHGKNQNRNRGKVAAHGMLGQRAGLGIAVRGVLLSDPKVLGNAWGRMTAAHSLPGVGQYNPFAQMMGYTVDWFAHQLYLRALGLDVTKCAFIIEHEWGPARDMNVARVMEAIMLSAQFVRGADAAADATFRSEDWCNIVQLPWPEFDNPLEEYPEIQQEAENVLAIAV